MAVALRQLNSICDKDHKVFFVLFCNTYNWGVCVCVCVCVHVCVGGWNSFHSFFKIRGHFKLISHLDSSPTHLYFSIVLFKKKSNPVVETYFFSKKIHVIFRFVTFPLEILEKTKLHPWNSKTKNQDPWKFHDFFWLSENSALDPWNFHMLLNTPWNSMS